MAKNNLLSFLFLESTEADAADGELTDNLERLFEAAAEVEAGELETKKTPLAKALAEFGIEDTDLQFDTEGFALVTDSPDKYRDILAVLGTPDAMHKLAEMGWVVTKPGDDAMTNEPANFRVRFLEIVTVETGDADKSDETRKEIINKAKEFATTPMDRDDEMNPVENEDGKMGKKAEGVGKPKEGKQPEKAMHEDRIEEFTGTGSMGTVTSMGQPFVGMVEKPKPYGKGTKFRMPGQWTVKQPVVKKQAKRKVHTESETVTELPVEQAAEAFLSEQAPGDDPVDGPELDPSEEEVADEAAEGTDAISTEDEMHQDMRNDLETGECAVITDRGMGGSEVVFNGRSLGYIGRDFPDFDAAIAALKAKMDEEQFWPNIYHINDHGNVSLLDEEGNTIRGWV